MSEFIEKQYVLDLINAGLSGDVLRGAVNNLRGIFLEPPDDYNDEEMTYHITRNGIMRSDGVIFTKNTFKESDGLTVPMVWDWNFYKPEGILGVAILENRDAGVYAKLIFNDTENAACGKKMLIEGDVEVSFNANKVKRDGALIKSAYIRRVHLCPSAFKYEED